MAKRKKLTDKELKELYTWNQYCFEAVRVLKGDAGDNLDSYFTFFATIFIKPEFSPKNIPLKDVILLFNSIEKEKTFSFEEMPIFFKSFYFDEVHIEKIKESDNETIGEHASIFEQNNKKNFIVATDIETELNASGNRYREDTKTKKHLVNFFGIKDLRFKHFLDSLTLFNEFMPLNTVPRQQFVSFFNGLEDLKNSIFELKNPEYVYEFNATDIVNGKNIYWKQKDIKHRFLIPFSRIKLKENINQNIGNILDIRNKLWQTIYPHEKRDLRKYYFGRFSQHPISYYFFRLLSEYDRELLVRNLTDVCSCCGNMFAYKKGKKYCSHLSEGKDCGKKYRNFKDYLYHGERRKSRSRRYMSNYRKLLKKHGIKNK